MASSQPAPLIDRTLPRQLLRWQGLVGLVAAGLVALFGSLETGLSLLAGAGTLWIGQAWFVWQAFRQSGLQALGGFYRGMIGKFVLVMLLLSVILASWPTLHGPSLFAGMLIVQGLSWIYPLLRARINTV